MCYGFDWSSKLTCFRLRLSIFTYLAIFWVDFMTLHTINRYFVLSRLWFLVSGLISAFDFVLESDNWRRFKFHFGKLLLSMRAVLVFN